MNIKVTMERYKNIIIGVLVLILIGIYVFRDSPIIDGHGEELNKLKLERESLIKDNDSIRKLNSSLDIKIIELNEVIKIKEDSLKITNDKIKKLQNGKTKVSDFVDGLDIDGVDRALTDYLETRQD